MALVWIVYAPTADKMGPDVERMNRVEEMPAELKRMWIADGSGREPTAGEVAAYEETQQAQAKADAADLGALKKDELIALAEQRGVDVSAAKTKADLVAALEAAPSEPTEPTGDVNPDSAATGEHVVQPMVVTDAQGNDATGGGEPS